MEPNSLKQQTPPNPQDVMMEKTKKILIMTLVGLFILFFLILIAYLLRKLAIDQAKRKELEKQAQFKTIQPSPIQNLNKVTAAPKLNLSFQQILNENCKNSEIDINMLPITVNNEFSSKIKYLPENKLACVGKENNRYIRIELIDRQRLNLYDKNSKEDGHGGPPFLGLYGLPAKSSGDIKINTYLSITEGPTPIKEIRLILRGQKTIYLNKGEEIFLNYEQVGIPAADSQLLTVLDKYSVSSQEFPGEKEIQNFNAAQVETANYFFKDLSSLDPKLSQAIKTIEGMLNQITGDPSKQEREQITPTPSKDVPDAPSKQEITGLFPNQVDAQDFIVEPINVNQNKIFLIKGVNNGNGQTSVPYFIIYDNTSKNTLYQSSSQVYLNSTQQAVQLLTNQEIKVSLNYYGYSLTEFIGYNEIAKQFIPKNLQHRDDVTKMLTNINQKASCQLVKDGPQILIIDIKNQYGENQTCFNGITVKEYFRIKALVESILQGKDLSVIN